MPPKPDSRQTLLRQWEMLRMVPRHPMKISATEIVDRLADMNFGVTKRTVERDLVALSVVFPLISDTRSLPFGWSWQPRAAPFDVPQLTLTQALAFVLMQKYLATLLPGSVSNDLEPYFRMAFRRLSDAAACGAGRNWLQRIRVIPPTQALIPPRIAPFVHAAATDSLLRDLKLGIAYRSRGSSKSRDAVISPLGLVQRGAFLYLVAVFEGHEDVRTLALHRISRAEVLHERAVRPSGFVLGRHVEAGFLDFGSGKQIELVALFEQEATIHLEEAPLSKDQKLEAAGNGMIKVTAAVAETPQLFWWLLGFGGRVEVLKPERLRKKMVEVAKAMGSRYAQAR